MVSTTKPRQVVFNLLKQTWGITHQEALAILGADYTIANYSGERKTALSREIVNIEPEKYQLATFAPFEESSARLVSRIHRSPRGPVSNEDIVSYLSGEAASTMREALDRYNFDGVLFSNTATDIGQDPRLRNADKAQLLILLFCSAGCTGNVRNAVDETLAANRSIGARFATIKAREKDDVGGNQRMYDFALLRIDPGGQGGRYVLSTKPEGTEIGRQVTSDAGISDVDMAVSKRHARIWRDESGSWWVQGLGSKNGTCIIDGATRETIVVEPPQAQRARTQNLADPVELHLSDVLVLADTTQFWVQAV